MPLPLSLVSASSATAVVLVTLLQLSAQLLVFSWPSKPPLVSTAHQESTALVATTTLIVTKATIALEDPLLRPQPLLSPQWEVFAQCSTTAPLELPSPWFAPMVTFRERWVDPLATTVHQVTLARPVSKRSAQPTRFVFKAKLSTIPTVRLALVATT